MCLYVHREKTLLNRYGAQAAFRVRCLLLSDRTMFMPQCEKIGCTKMVKSSVFFFFTSLLQHNEMCLTRAYSEGLNQPTHPVQVLQHLLSINEYVVVQIGI